MKVVILCGGLGTRLREETEYRPKPMVDVGGRPILWHIMKMYAHFGFWEFVVCLGYKGHVIKEYFLNYEAMNRDFTIDFRRRERVQYHSNNPDDPFMVTLADTGQDTQTGGRIKAVEKYLDSDTFCVTYGDGVADVDLGAVLRFHKEHGKLATLTAVRPVSRYGQIAVDAQGGVSQFMEKPNLDGWISAGFFVLERKVLDYIDGESCIFEREPMERLAKEGQLAAYQHGGFFYAMDTYREYKHLNDLWHADTAPWKQWQ